MGSSGGKNPLKRLTENPLDMIADGLINWSTFGLVGMENGKLGKGVATGALDEGLGEVTGRNLQRKAAGDAERRVNEEFRIREAEMAQERIQDERKDRSASMMAQGARRTAAARSNGRVLNWRETAETDLLGL